MIVTLTAIACITFLEALAMYYGIDGTLLRLGFTIIGGLGGYAVHRKLKK